MSITILSKTSLVVYLDKTLINILGNRAWIGRRLTDHLYDYDCVLLQSKLNKIAEKINAGFKKIHEIEPFYLRILKINDSTQDTKKNKKSSNAIWDFRMSKQDHNSAKRRNEKSRWGVPCDANRF